MENIIGEDLLITSKSYPFLKIRVAFLSSKIFMNELHCINHDKLIVTGNSSDCCSSSQIFISNVFLREGNLFKFKNWDITM